MSREVLRTPDPRFEGLPGRSSAPHYLEWDGLRVHYLDEGPRGGPPVLLLHGEPTWSRLYAGVTPRLAAAGYRCIAYDHVGFGRSDKVVDDDWYVIERHVECAAHVIRQLDLRGITLVVQDWGGPIGLRQAVDMPERFARLLILNTWLHHDGFEYTPMIRGWRDAATDPAKLGGDMPCGRIVAGTLRRPGHDLAAVQAVYDAPFPDARYKAGPRRFPWCLPFARPVEGNAADQQRCFDALPRLGLPTHFVFGDADPIFPFEWAARWSRRIPGATLDRIAGAGHFLQQDAPDDLAAAMLRRLAGEAA
jgi:haloalkane dehalogenase